MRYLVVIADPAKARGTEPSLAFRAHAADGLATELAEALRSPALFERWRALQPDPEQVDAALGSTDPAARVHGEQHDLHIELAIVTTLPGRLLSQRLRWLAGDGWTLNDVRPA